MLLLGGCGGQGPTTRAATELVAGTDAGTAGTAAPLDEAPAPTAGTTVRGGTDPAPAGESSDGCEVAEAIARDVAAVRQLTVAAEQLDALGTVLDGARPLLAEVDPAGRQLVEQLVGLVDVLRVGAVDARARAAGTGDPEVVALVDELVVHLHDIVLNPLALTAALPEAERCPTLEAVATASDLPLDDPAVAVREVRDALVARGHGDIVDDYLPPGFVDLTDRDMTVALSGRQADYDRCWTDLAATTYGDNEGCDALHDACDGRDLLACNDLYWASPVGSDYEDFGASCGGRAGPYDMAVNGFCERLP